MPKASSTEARESTQLLAMGLGVATVGVVGAVAGAAVCPVCVVATPALLGMGLYKRWKERELSREVAADDAAPAPGRR